MVVGEYGSVVSEFNRRFEGLTADQCQRRYERLARAALAAYGLADAACDLLQHNAGIAYRVTAPGGECFHLKIAEPAGEGWSPEPERLRAGLAWVAALACDTDLTVQGPVPNRGGELLTAVAFDDLSEPFNCSLQRWVDGERVAGHYTPEHARAVGVMTARLHAHGRGWLDGANLPAFEMDEASLAACLEGLHVVVGLGVLTAAQWAVVAAAVERIGVVMAALGRGPDVHGPVHGDLHQGNLLFRNGAACPIDFGELTRAHHAHDLGTTLYHLMYLGPDVRAGLIEGYRSIRSLEPWPDLTLEAFVCAAAIGNLAFQMTLPSERASAITARNVRQLADDFAAKLVAGEPFVLS
jgi:Ser/Thr protein kinase RdoA (MazF antagonist)